MTFLFWAIKSPGALQTLPLTYTRILNLGFSEVFCYSFVFPWAFLVHDTHIHIHRHTRTHTGGIEFGTLENLFVTHVFGGQQNWESRFLRRRLWIALGQRAVLLLKSFEPGGRGEDSIRRFTTIVPFSLYCTFNISITVLDFQISAFTNGCFFLWFCSLH